MITQFFFFNDTATTEIYTLSLHDALPISYPRGFLDGWYQGLKYWWFSQHEFRRGDQPWYYYLMLLPIYELMALVLDRKSTRLNSSHANISYAVFCLKKKKTKTSS